MSTSLGGTCDPRCRQHLHHNSRSTLWVHPAHHLGSRDPPRSCSILYVHAVSASAVPGSMVHDRCHAAHLDPIKRLATLHRAHDSARAGAQVGANAAAASTRVTRVYWSSWRGRPLHTRTQRSVSTEIGTITQVRDHHDCRALHVGGLTSLSVRRVAIKDHLTDLAWVADKRYLGDLACGWKCQESTAGRNWTDHANL